jgi:hypothetical protein
VNCASLARSVEVVFLLEIQLDSSFDEDVCPGFPRQIGSCRFAAAHKPHMAKIRHAGCIGNLVGTKARRLELSDAVDTIVICLIWRLFAAYLNDMIVKQAFGREGGGARIVELDLGEEKLLSDIGNLPNIWPDGPSGARGRPRCARD